MIAKVLVALHVALTLATLVACFALGRRFVRLLLELLERERGGR